jgi:hypothetical protein
MREWEVISTLKVRVGAGAGQLRAEDMAMWSKASYSQTVRILVHVPILDSPRDPTHCISKKKNQF